MSNRLAVTCCDGIRSASAVPVMVISALRTAPTASNEWLWSRQSRKFRYDTVSLGNCGQCSANSTSLCGSRYGSGRSSTAFTMLNIALFAPIPNASVSTATHANPLSFLSLRNAYRKFRATSPIPCLLF